MNKEEQFFKLFAGDRGFMAEQTEAQRAGVTCRGTHDTKDQELLTPNASLSEELMLSVWPHMASQKSWSRPVLAL